MADIFISYTSSDRDWAFWIARELEALGHMPRVHEWEIKQGADIFAWMEERHDAADHVLCVVSDDYLRAPYSTLERHAALWQAASKRPGFVILVVVKPCRLPTLTDHLSRCEVFGMSEAEARTRFHAFMEKRKSAAIISFPGTMFAVSNIPMRVPAHFMGRDDSLAAIESALQEHMGRATITALHGLRGVGKSTLAAAYAERHRGDYRATWWIRAQTDSGMRADMAALGIRLNWVAADEKEEQAIAAVMERLRHEGEGILLIFDNAPDAAALTPYLPRGGHAQVLITSNARTWRGIAAPVEIHVWSTEIGAAYLIARTGRANEREAAVALSQALGGLPLAHEQAAAYCERLELSLAAYRQRFEASPARLLDDQGSAPSEYSDGLTVAKTFALAIEKAGKLHPAAEALITHAALLPSEPIPLFLFAEAHEEFGDPLASALADDGLDDVVAALRAFALVDREIIPDERDPSVTTDCIRLHRLVRQVVAARCTEVAREDARRALIQALARVLSDVEFNDPGKWPSVRRLDALVMSMIGGDAFSPRGAETQAAYLASQVAMYHQTALGAYAKARSLYERALALYENALGHEHPYTATSLNNLACALFDAGDLAKARPLFERALAIRQKALGPEHPDTAIVLKNLANLLRDHGELDEARQLSERALTILEGEFGSNHPKTADALNDLALVLDEQGDLNGARCLYERALAIREEMLDPEHPDTATSLNNLALLLKRQNDLTAAQPLYERALIVHEKIFGSDHPVTQAIRSNLASLLWAKGDLKEAQILFERTLAIRERLGPESADVALTMNNLAALLKEQGNFAEARPLYERALVIREKVLGPEHPHTVAVRDHLASLLQSQPDLSVAQPPHERASATHEKVLGPEHSDAGLIDRDPEKGGLAIGETENSGKEPDEAARLTHRASLLQDEGDLLAARALYERALIIQEKVLGSEHLHTTTTLNNLALVLLDQGEPGKARPLFERALAIREKILGPEHPETMIVLNNLVVLLMNRDDPVEARPFLERMLGVQEKVLGSGHPDTAVSLNQLGVLLYNQDDVPAARPLLERALAIREKALGREHPDTATSLNNLAALRQKEGDLSVALLLFKRALAIREKALGVDHPKTNTSATFTAEALDSLGRADEAAALRMRYGIE